MRWKGVKWAITICFIIIYTFTCLNKAKCGGRWAHPVGSEGIAIEPIREGPAAVHALHGEDNADPRRDELIPKSQFLFGQNLIAQIEAPEEERGPDHDEGEEMDPNGYVEQDTGHGDSFWGKYNHPFRNFRNKESNISYIFTIQYTVFRHESYPSSCSLTNRIFQIHP